MLLSELVASSFILPISILLYEYIAHYSFSQWVFLTLYYEKKKLLKTFCTYLVMTYILTSLGVEWIAGSEGRYMVNSHFL